MLLTNSDVFMYNMEAKFLMKTSTKIRSYLASVITKNFQNVAKM